MGGEDVEEDKHDDRVGKPIILYQLLSAISSHVSLNEKWSFEFEILIYEMIILMYICGCC